MLPLDVTRFNAGTGAEFVIDETIFRPSGVSVRETLEKLNKLESDELDASLDDMPSGSLTLGITAAFSMAQAIKTLIEAVRRVHDRHGDVSLSLSFEKDAAEAVDEAQKVQVAADWTAILKSPFSSGIAFNPYLVRGTLPPSVRFRLMTGNGAIALLGLTLPREERWAQIKKVLGATDPGDVLASFSKEKLIGAIVERILRSSDGPDGDDLKFMASTLYHESRGRVFVASPTGALGPGQFTAWWYGTKGASTPMRLNPFRYPEVIGAMWNFCRNHEKLTLREKHEVYMSGSVARDISKAPPGARDLESYRAQVISHAQQRADFVLQHSAISLTAKEKAQAFYIDPLYKVTVNGSFKPAHAGSERSSSVPNPVGLRVLGDVEDGESCECKELKY